MWTLHVDLKVYSNQQRLKILQKWKYLYSKWKFTICLISWEIWLVTLESLDKKLLYMKSKYNSKVREVVSLAIFLHFDLTCMRSWKLAVEGNCLTFSIASSNVDFSIITQWFFLRILRMMMIMVMRFLELFKMSSLRQPWHTGAQLLDFHKFWGKKKKEWE